MESVRRGEMSLAESRYMLLGSHRRSERSTNSQLRRGQRMLASIGPRWATGWLLQVMESSEQPVPGMEVEHRSSGARLGAGPGMSRRQPIEVLVGAKVV